MTPERYQQIGRLFDEALELAPEQRADFLEQACSGDAGLRAEVEKLLAHHVESEDFLSRPALQVAAALCAQQQTLAAPGQQIGHYQIISLLGTGGMGQVYLARDTQLGRQVALKLLPEQFTGSQTHVWRFAQEAKAASALNHPNIITIHEIGEAEGKHYIITEFVEGQTLRKLLSGPMPLQTVLEIAVQIADALVAAHNAGIVHRDLKPENVMVRPDGLVKVLDFGLAKLTELRIADCGLQIEEGHETLIQNPQSAIRNPQLTEPGTMMGTINYMSPEQALAQKIDQRTDIFSLGVMLHEMVTGERPFKGASSPAIYDAILHHTPAPVTESYPDLPHELQWIIDHALEKDRELRFQTASDLKAALKTLKRDSGSGTVSATRVATRQPLRQPGWRSWFPKAVIASGAVIVLAIAGYLFWSGSETTKTPPARIIPFTTFSGAADQPAFSPDGNQIAFSWDGGYGENLDIYVKLIGAGAPLRLTTDPAEDISPAWAPDGRYLAFLRRSTSENGIFIVPALGGAERKLGKTEPNLSRLAWSPDGKFLALVDRNSPEDRYGIFLLSVEDGEKHSLTSPPASSADNYPAFSPDGKTLAFLRSGSLSSEDIFLVPTRGGDTRRLTADERRIQSLAWTADGREIVFSSNRGGGFSLWSVAISGGTPERLAVTGQNAYSPAISRQGNRLAYNVSFLDSNIWRLDRSASRQNSPVKLIASTRQDHSPQFSPDGKKIVFASDRSGSDEIWMCESDGSHPAQLTFFDGPTTGTPRWSPDGQQIVFDARPAGNSDIYVMSAEGGKPRALTQEPSHDVMPSWSRNGRWIYFCSNRSGAFQVWKAPAAGGPAAQVTQRGGFEAFESADGELLYYTKGRGPGGIWQMPVAGGEETQVPELLDAGYWRYWGVLDKGIYFVAPVASARPAIKFFSFANHKVMQIGELERGPLQGPPGLTVSPDGRWILYSQADQSISDIMLVENFRRISKK